MLYLMEADQPYCRERYANVSPRFLSTDHFLNQNETLSRTSLAPNNVWNSLWEDGEVASLADQLCPEESTFLWPQ